MVPNNTNNNIIILLEVLASLFTVSAYFPDNPRTLLKFYHSLVEPILLYVAELLLSDFNINTNKCDNLPFEINPSCI